MRPNSTAICPDCQRPIQPANEATGAPAMCRECGQVFELVEPSGFLGPATTNWRLSSVVSLLVVCVLIAIAYPFVMSWIDDWYKMSAVSNGKNIAFAIIQFDLKNKRLPAAYRIDEKRQPLLSWRVHILPFLGEDALYKQFRLDEPWDSPHNAALLDKMPATYQSPGVTLPAGHTCWLATVGERSLIALPGDRRSWGPGFLGIKNGDILDGSSQTFVFVEVNPSAAVPWTAPRDYQYDLQNPLREFGGIRPGPSFLAAFADARIVALRPSSPNIEDTMQRVYQRDDWTEKEAQDYVDEP